MLKLDYFNEFLTQLLIMITNRLLADMLLSDFQMLKPGVNLASLENVARAPLFCSVLHSTLSHTRSVSEAEHLAFVYFNLKMSISTLKNQVSDGLFV